MFRNIPRSVKTLFLIYTSLILTATLFRVLLYWFNLHQVAQIPANESGLFIKRAFIVGWQFDTVITSYLLVIPFLLFFTLEWMKKKGAAIIIASELFLQISTLILLTIYCIDIPYYNYNGSRVTNAVFQWMNTPDVVIDMLIKDIHFLIFILLFLMMAIGMGYILHQIFKIQYYNSHKEYVYPSTKKVSVYFLITLILIAFGAKGTLTGASLRLGDAVFCNYAFPNQLSNNAAFSLIKNMMDKVDFMDDEDATKQVQQLLKIENPSKEFTFAREVKSDFPMNKMNVVVVLMESMTAANLEHFGNPQHLTPHIDSLLQHGISFENAYSAGIHTNNGIFSTLYSYPSSWRVRPMSATKISTFTGFAGVLKHFGYKNYYFTTHSKGFDNACVFIPKNHVDTIICEDNYPKEKIVGPFGVPDHVEFDKAIEVFNQHPATQPFFASILTTSNHPPIVIPQNIGFKQRSSAESDAVIEYADWAIGDFMQKASQQSWFKNTVFVFVADHGANRYASCYDLILNYNHILMIIYSPSLITEPKHISTPCGQIDAMPTIMGLLNCSYVNNTPGIDVLHQKRPYIFFSADDKLGCIDEEYLFVYRKNKTESLYKYKNGDLNDYKNDLKAKTDSMRNYTFSMMQASQCAVINDKVGWVKEE